MRCSTDKELLPNTALLFVQIGKENDFTDSSNLDKYETKTQLIKGTRFTLKVKLKQNIERIPYKSFKEKLPYYYRYHLAED